MAGDEMASPSPPVAALTNDLIAEIFLRLPTPEDLVRASAACVSFRRLVTTDRSFLRRFRSLHAPPFVGFLDHRGFHPALPPHPSAPVARAVADAADFALSFLPSPAGSWMVRDVRGGRVLVDRDTKAETGGSEKPLVFTEIAVCDPLRRRFLLLPPIPDDLAASVDRPVRVHLDRWCEPFLAPHIEEEEDDTSFKVIWMAQCKAKIIAFVFNSSTGQWLAGASPSTTDLFNGAGLSPPPSSSSPSLVFSSPGRVFSAIVEAGEGMTGIFALRGSVGGTFDLHYSIWGKEGATRREQMEKIIPLDHGYRYYIRGAMEKHLLLARSRGEGEEDTPEEPDLECFSLDVKTLQLEPVCVLKYYSLHSVFTVKETLVEKPSLPVPKANELKIQLKHRYVFPKANNLKNVGFGAVGSWLRSGGEVGSGGESASDGSGGVRRLGGLEAAEVDEPEEERRVVDGAVAAEEVAAGDESAEGDVGGGGAGEVRGRADTEEDLLQELVSEGGKLTRP
uniref:F-box domain-containing protein n=1 Tax=Oryza rufipogon TaxID=4529 RepID=A0A0E0Q9R2_ORYRU